MKFVANLSFLFNELPFMERFEAAKKAGFKYVEFMFPYEYDIDEIKGKLDEYGLEIVLFNFPAGNWAAGDRGIANNSERVEEFKGSVELAVTTAKRLGVKRLNCFSGTHIESKTDSELWSTLVSNLQYAADILASNGITLLVEPINHYDMTGFYLNTVEKGSELIKAVNKPNFFLQYDVYHAEREGEDHLSIIDRFMPIIGHIQIADNPGRNQPGTGDIDFQTLFGKIEGSGYSGYISMEYKPNPDTLASLEWVEKFGYNLKG